MKRCLTFSSGVLLRHPPPKNIHDVAVLIETNLESRVRHASASLCPMATVYNDAAVSNGSRREISDRTRCPGAWRIGGWGLRRRTRNGEYQVRGFLAPDIPNHCRQLKSFSKSSTGRETLRSGWSAVRNRSSCFPFAWLVMVVFPGGRFSQRTSFCLARCTGRLWCHPRQASRRDAACRARRDNGSHRSRRRA